MICNIPKYINQVINRLEAAGFEAFIVGGSVRDMILGKIPHDYDITTSATPDEIQEVFMDINTIQVGKQFGTIVLIQPEGNTEVTTYRSEGKYLDGRRPSEVSFSKKISEDLSRRDFTINAIAYNRRSGIIDLFNGRDDLRAGIIRTVGNPLERFSEDHLRILRALRLSTKLGFTIENETYNACKDLSNKLEYISVERIREELFKMLLCKNPSKGIRMMKDLKILDIIIPELLGAVGFDQKHPSHDKDVFEHILCVLDNSPPVIIVRLAALLHDIAKPKTLTIDENGVGHFYGHDKMGSEMAEQILLRLKCSNHLIENVSILIREHMSQHNEMKDRGLKRQISRVGEDNIFNLLSLQKADRICSNPNADIEFLLEREKQIKNILEYKEPYKKEQLNINGNDIIALGYSQGKLIGEILDYILDKVMREPELNEKEKLIDLVKQKYKDIE